MDGNEVKLLYMSSSFVVGIILDIFRKREERFD